jgi:subtilase family serine protease
MRPKKLFAIQCTALLTLLSIPALQASAQSSNVQQRITQVVDESKLTVLKGNTYPLARAEFDRGPAPASLPMERMLLVLKRSPEQEAALNQLMAGQLDKSSPNFHKWLTPEQFGQQFGPSDQDVQTVTSWLGSHGFQVVEVSKGRTVIQFSGNAGQVQEAFRTPIHKFVVNGEEHWANVNDPQIPTALAPVVVGINTLHNFPKKSAHRYAGEFRRSKETGKMTAVNPQFTYPNQNLCSGNCFLLGPSDFATIYNVQPLWTAHTDGTGVTIGVVGLTDISPQDNADFRSIFGLPASNLTVFTNGPDPGTLPTEEPEADIDTQWSGAVAKGAKILYVETASTNTAFGVDLSAQFIVDNNSAPILTDSYGLCEAFLGAAGNSFYYDLWQQAAAEGISVLDPTGDNGSAGCDNDNVPGPAQFGLQVNGSATTPFNVAVGGTDFNDANNATTFWSLTNNSTTQSSALSYIPEVVWNNSCASVEWGVDFGFSTDPVANCNNNTLDDVVVVGGSGGVSGCTMGTSGTVENVTGCFGGYVKPPWQAGLGVPNDGKRDVPDVSLFAGNGFNTNAYIVCQEDANSQQGGNANSCDLTTPFTDFQAYGGTSVSTPAMAGILAMVIQTTGDRLGVPNAVLYKLAAQAGATCDSNGTVNASCIFYDLQAGAGTNAMPCTPNTTNCTASGSNQFGVLPAYSTATGYDQASGLGSVNAFNLVTKWNSAVFGPDFSLSLPSAPAAPAPLSLTVASPGGMANTMITITGTNGYSGTVTFSASSCAGLPAESTCSFTPTSVTGSGSTQLTITTTAKSKLVPMSHHLTPVAQVGAARLMQVFLSFAILWLGIQASRRKLCWNTVASLLAVGCLLGIAACGGGGGGGGGNPGTPVTTNQSVVITASDGTNTHSIYLLLTVN